MSINLGAEFQAQVSGTFENVQSSTPIFNTNEPEVTVNPQLIDDVVSGGAMLQELGDHALSGPVQNEGILGGVLSAMSTLAHDVRDAGNNIMQAEMAQTGRISTGLHRIVGDTTPTLENQVHTHVAQMSDPEPAAAPAPSMT